ncbi:hypothetical protein D5F01_LYC19168 [Larimichthys crocea]|uniref:Uncharacterized protein n=1 Tax=Larimichthys crocea TaxID=215358 RepID=A0A6G0HRF4_LARCR|nr:hypothetical protein D5F01_LYC19168 [Larimichthys crocea]
MAEAAPGAGPQSPRNPGVKEDPPDIDGEASEKQAKPRIPHRIILYGEGLQSWSPAVHDYFMRYVDGREPSEVEDEIVEAMAGNGYYYAPQLMGSQAIMILKHPTEVKKEVQAWLTWWINLMDRWREGRITALISPSKKGALLRAMSKEDDRRSITEDPPEESPASDQENSTAGRQGSGTDSEDPEINPQEEPESEPDLGPNPDEDLATVTEITSDVEEDRGVNRGLTPEGNLNLPSALNREATPSIRRLLKASEQQGKHLARQGELLRKMANYHPRPQTSAQKKRKEKQKHLLPPTDSESEEERRNDERLRPLARLPDEIRRIPSQGKLGVYQWIGSPWQIDGDALLVFTDINLKIYNATFRRDLGPHVQSMRTHKKGAYVLFHAHVQMYQT